MLSPQVSVTSPDGANLPAISTRRRGLSYLRGLSQNRSSPPNPSDTPPRTSPRSYFVRSTSYNESPRSLAPDITRRRSASRPNEGTRSTTTQPSAEPPTDTVNTATIIEARRDPSPPAQTRRAQSATREQVGEQVGSAAEDAPDSENMARHRTASSKKVTSTSETLNARLNGDGSTDASQNPQTNRQVSKTSTTNGEPQPESKGQLPTIRLFPHQEPRSARQSLNFVPVSRTLPHENAVIRVGRYSEREGIPITNPTTPSDAPVGFKSKVVSRKHCEFTYVNDQWHVKDVSSSSGTFLNHIRLSQPNTDSRLFPVKDGDILQLGIDFRGGEEMIFRCVKIRIECNRSWQKRPNNFNKSRHAQLQSLTKDQPTGGESSNSGECAICLGSMLPYQALFVAPCAHAWHYKCIRPMLEGKTSTYPQFQCPNCRAYADLSADVDVSVEDMDEAMGEAGDDTNDEEANNDQAASQNGAGHAANNAGEIEQAESVVAGNGSVNGGGPVTPMSSSGLLSRRQAANHGSPEINAMNGIEIPDRYDPDEATHDLGPEVTRTEFPDVSQTIAGEGPLTPRNNAGPFVFDGSAGRSAARENIASSIPGSPE